MIYELEEIMSYKFVRKNPTKQKNEPYFSFEILPIYVLKVIEKEYLAHY
jgi:hypothetical protein